MWCSGPASRPSSTSRWLVETLLAFFLAMGLAAHALDELNGRPLRTRIPDGVLWAIAVVGLAGAVGARDPRDGRGLAVAVGVHRRRWVPRRRVQPGAVRGCFHSDLWFALGWGAFPALTAYFAQTATLRVDAVFVAAGCAALSAAQRVLSTPVRRLRRTVASVSGELVTTDGDHEPLDATSLRAAPEGALRWLSAGRPAPRRGDARRPRLVRAFTCRSGPSATVE